MLIVKLRVISQLLLTLVKLIKYPLTLIWLLIRSTQKLFNKSLTLIDSKLVKLFDFIFPSRRFIIKHERVKKVS